jgi:hypothetical protein
MGLEFVGSAFCSAHYLLLRLVSPMRQGRLCEVDDERCNARLAVGVTYHTLYKPSYPVSVSRTTACLLCILCSDNRWQDEKRIEDFEDIV